MIGKALLLDIQVDNLNDDGTCDITFEVDQETLIMLAKIGMKKVLEDTVKELEDGHLDAKGARNEGTGEGGIDPLSGDFPGF